MIPDRSDRVPDAIEPLTGYRAWQFVFGDNEAWLLPLTHASLTASGWDGANRGWVAATCPFQDAEPVSDQRMERFEEFCSRFGVPFGDPHVREPHTVPGEECSCGFYAMRDTLEVTMAMDCRPDVILGRVRLAGKVIECTDGFRAERARIDELIPIAGNEGPARRLALLFGLPLAPPLLPWSGLPPAA